MKRAMGCLVLLAVVTVTALTLALGCQFLGFRAKVEAPAVTGEVEIDRGELEAPELPEPAPEQPASE